MPPLEVAFGACVCCLRPIAYLRFAGQQYITYYTDSGPSYQQRSTILAT